MTITLTAEGSGYFYVYMDGVEVSRHVAEREAIERSVNLKEENPSSVIHYEHRYSVNVDSDAPVPGPVPEPVPEPTPAPDNQDGDGGRIISSFPYHLSMANASANGIIRTSDSATATYLPTGGWNGNAGYSFTMPEVYQGYSAIRNVTFATNPTNLYMRFMFWASADWCVDSGWGGDPNQKMMFWYRSTGNDLDRLMIRSHGYSTDKRDLEICNGVGCTHGTPAALFDLDVWANQRWVCIEVQGDIPNGLKRLWVTTDDGTYYDELWAETALNSTNGYWNYLDLLGFYNGPVTDTDMYFKISGVKFDTSKIGPPVGFGT